ncbi:MAG TPA: cob(I)yrinic acid a,c-diamide adenosyltransferase [Anaerolineae bacterium]|nr:cob(I)yrinic acid a,c-diamide adenosyltransferase [Anaerolineae bacterium]
MSGRLSKGYVQVYTGDGKGKTTAALGLALRASGHGMHTYIGQFMKGQHYGELDALRDHPYITVEQYGDVRCIRREEVTPEHVAQAHQGLERAREAMLSGRYDIVVLDEINVSIWFGLLTVEEVLTFRTAIAASETASGRSSRTTNTSSWTARPLWGC